MACEGAAVVQNSEADCPSEELVHQISTGGIVKSLGGGNEQQQQRKRESAKWDQWSDWAECSVSCGDHGVQRRTRKCRSPVETVKNKGRS
jgi:hypothetical protein